jgi:hypothetical protein
MKYASLSFPLVLLMCCCTNLLAQTPGPDLTVNVNAERHHISPDIYGVNNYSVDLTIFNNMNITVQRWGGDATSLYNWQVDSSNAGLDWFYIGGSGTDPSRVIPGQTVDAMINFDDSHSAKSVITIPITGWVNKFSQWNCSYPISLYPDQGLQWGQYTYWPYLTDDSPTIANGSYCGSGLSPANDGSEITQTDIARNHLAVNPAWMQWWITHLMKTDDTGKDPRSGLIYQMDNEPESWNNIHHDIHPYDITYDELVKDTIVYASMIKRTDPSGRVLGPSNCCVWSEWDLSPSLIGDDGVASPFPAPYDMPWYKYYLTKMQEYQQESHVRVLDYFDFHFYPEVDGVSIANSPAGDQATQAARLRSTRALWDPTYVTEDWMGTYFPTTYGTPMLIRRMRTWVDQYYPGTKIAITEYNWGGLEDINGALAQADVLGIFGREGLDMATLWGPPAADQPGAFAFQIYTNYDGLGSEFGNLSVKAESADQSQLSIYAALNRERGILTVIVINKSSNPLASKVVLRNVHALGRNVEVYRYSSDNLAAIVPETSAPLTVATNNEPAIAYQFPVNSITLFAIPIQSDGDDNEDVNNDMRESETNAPANLAPGPALRGEVSAAVAAEKKQYLKQHKYAERH